MKVIIAYPDLNRINELVYEKCGFELTHFQKNEESTEYAACRFKLNYHKVIHRTSKITPNKIGQFVTIWKRNNEGKTEPFDVCDDFDFLIITSKKDENVGQFIFPKLVLEENGIIAREGKGGKRGFRVYPSWDIATNKQAKKSQSWQTKYFVILKEHNIFDFKFVRDIFETK